MNPKEIESHIKNRYADKSFDVNCLSRELKLSDSYLREIINLNYNCSPHWLIETIRMEKAIQLLCDNQLTIYTVCSKVGYANLKTFRTAFKKRNGLTPDEFRTKIKEEKTKKKEVEKAIENLRTSSNI